MSDTDMTAFGDMTELQQCQTALGMLTQALAVSCSAHAHDQMANALAEAFASMDYERLATLAGKLAGAIVLAGGGVTRAGATH